MAFAVPLVALLLSAPVAANDDDRPSDVQTYNIPAQPLGSALPRYSATSGVDFLLDEPEAAGRQSSAVIGSYTPPQALHILLEGTGLAARFTSRTSAVIAPIGRAPNAATSSRQSGGAVVTLDMMRVTAPRLIGSVEPPINLQFLHRLASGIHAAIYGANLAERGAGASLRIQTRITDDGRLYEVRIATPSADPRRDARIVALLEGRQLDLVPPKGMRQPLLFDVRGR